MDLQSVVMILVAALLVLLPVAIWLEVKQQKGDPRPFDPKEDWKEDRMVSLIDANWEFYRTRTLLSFRNECQLIDSEGRIVITVRFEGKRSIRGVLDSNSGVSLTVLRESKGLGAIIRYLDHEREIARLVLTGNALFPSNAPLQYGDRQIERRREKSLIMVRGRTYLEGPKIIAKVRSLSMFANQPDAIAVQKSLPLELKMILFHLSRLSG